MKPLRILIIVSITANIALAGWWFKSRNAAANPDSATVESTQSAGKSGGRFGKGSAAQTAANETIVSTEAGATGAITTWLDIQSADLKQLVRRLREAGCPDETVKDIVVAEVNRIYAARNRELWPERYDDNAKFWKTQNNRYNSEQQKKQRESWRKDRELQKEKSALLVELLGVDPEKQQRIEDGYDEFYFNWQERQVSFLPESKRAAAQKILDEFQDKQQEMYAANQGIHDAQSRAEQKQLEAEKLAALAGILSPSELRDYELRQSQTASQLTHDLRGLSLSREEYEAIFDTKKKYGDSIYNYGDLGKEGQKQAEENMKAMKADLAASLGADKFKEYERGTDYYYRQLQSLAKKNDLPAETAGKVFDYKSTAEDTVKQLRANKDMTNEQRQTALQQIRAETEDTLMKTLGEKTYKSYIKNGGWWINNIAPQQSSGTATRAGNVIIKAQ
jgi:hypothetical protein